MLYILVYTATQPRSALTSLVSQSVVIVSGRRPVVRLTPTARRRRMNLLSQAKLVWQLLPDDMTSAAGQEDCPIRSPSDVTFIGRNTFAVADSEAHKILIFDIERQMWTEIGHDQVWPNAIAATPEGNIVVTDRKRNAVVTFNLAGNFLSSFDVYIPEIGVEEGYETPCHPHGVAVTSTGDIIVTDTGTNTIKIFAETGELQKEFGSKGTDLWELRLPFYCKTDSKDNIIVSDNMNYCVKVFDHNGNYQLRIGSGVDWGQRQFLCPYGICADPMDNILVADNETGKLVMFDTEGGFVRTVLNKADGCYSPSGVAVGPCGHLVVTESAPDHANVKVYQLYE